MAAPVIGGIIGAEREPPGPDRASNIVTGIGFLGAGVIFKDKIGISGLTTATSIWVTAALGMVAGAGELGLKGLLQLSDFSVTTSDILSVEYSVYGLGPDGTDSVGTT